MPDLTHIEPERREWYATAGRFPPGGIQFPCHDLISLIDDLQRAREGCRKALTCASIPDSVRQVIVDALASTRRLSPERLEEIRKRTLALGASTELLDHLDAVEAERDESLVSGRKMRETINHLIVDNDRLVGEVQWLKERLKENT